MNQKKREFSFFSAHIRVLISLSNESHGQNISEQEFLSFRKNPIGRKSRGLGSILEEDANKFMNPKPFLSGFFLIWKGNEMPVFNQH